MRGRLDLNWSFPGLLSCDDAASLLHLFREVHVNGSVIGIVVRLLEAFPCDWLVEWGVDLVVMAFVIGDHKRLVATQQR